MVMHELLESKRSGVIMVRASLEQSNATIEYDSAIMKEHQLMAATLMDPLRTWDLK